jgi:hypothetical protein
VNADTVILSEDIADAEDQHILRVPFFHQLRNSAVHVPRAGHDLLDHFPGPGARRLIHRINKSEKRFFPDFPGFRRGEIDQVFHERRGRIRIAMVLDISRFSEIHEVFARPSKPVAARAERRNVSDRRDIPDHLVKRTVVAQ